MEFPKISFRLAHMKDESQKKKVPSEIGDKEQLGDGLLNPQTRAKSIRNP
jgi:hypothetical protein